MNEPEKRREVTKQHLLDLWQMDSADKAEGTTRSGRRFSGAGTKRKREKSSESEPQKTRAKMTGGASTGTKPTGNNWTWEDFTAYLSGELQKNRVETVSSITGRLEAAEAGL